MVLLLHSQHQYIFDYDSGDRLSAVTMPSVARHTMQTIRSIGYYRNMYTPPESNASVTVDYSEDGQVSAFSDAKVLLQFQTRNGGTDLTG